jgi:hypothetical protein
MINAQEAKTLYDKSGTEVQDYLTYNVEDKIIDHAARGKRYYIHDIGSSRAPLPKIPPLMQGVIDELKRLGYVVQYGFYGESYVPRGLADDSGEGPSFQNIGVTIGW